MSDTLPLDTIPPPRNKNVLPRAILALSSGESTSSLRAPEEEETSKSSAIAPVAISEAPPSLSGDQEKISLLKNIAIMQDVADSYAKLDRHPPSGSTREERLKAIGEVDAGIGMSRRFFEAFWEAGEKVASVLPVHTSEGRLVKEAQTVLIDPDHPLQKYDLEFLSGLDEGSGKFEPYEISLTITDTAVDGPGTIEESLVFFPDGFGGHTSISRDAGHVAEASSLIFPGESIAIYQDAPILPEEDARISSRSSFNFPPTTLQRVTDLFSNNVMKSSHILPPAAT